MPWTVVARAPAVPEPLDSSTSSSALNASISAPGSSALATMSRSLQLSAQRRALPASSTRMAAGCSRSAGHHRLADLQRLGQQRARLLLAVGPGGQRRQHVLLGLGAEPGHRAQLLGLGRLLEVVQRCDAQLVVQQLGPLGPQAGDAGDLDQARRDAVSQLDRGGDVAVGQQRVDLLGDGLADPGQVRGPALRGQLGNRLARVADGLRGVAVGQHAVDHGAVEFVERSKLLEGGGDLGVLHRHGGMRRVRAHVGRLARAAYIQRGREPRERRASGAAPPGDHRAGAPRAGRGRQLARRHGRRSPTAWRRRSMRSRCSTAPSKDGIGPAYLAGFGVALEQGAELLMEMDSDFSHDPADLPRLIAATEDADLVLGSRYVPGGGVTDWGLGRARHQPRRVAATRRSSSGIPVRDLTGGFKCFRRAVLERARPERRGHRRLRLPDRGDLSRGAGGLPRPRGADRLPRPPRGMPRRCLRRSPSRPSGRCRCCGCRALTAAVAPAPLPTGRYTL